MRMRLDFVWEDNRTTPGFSSHGISEEFPLHGARSFYGASKLACELLVQEYVYGYGMAAVINRCGILTGPWQMGKVDQGVVTLWVAHHCYFGRPLRYMGYGGQGKQVRDLLHVDDLFDLLLLQLRSTGAWNGQIYNVGGGNDVSASLRELRTYASPRPAAASRSPRCPKPAASICGSYISDFRKAQRNWDGGPSTAQPRSSATSTTGSMHTTGISKTSSAIRPDFPWERLPCDCRVLIPACNEENNRGAPHQRLAAEVGAFSDSLSPIPNPFRPCDRAALLA